MFADTIHTALRSVMIIPGVTGFVTVSKEEHHTSVEANQLPGTLINSVVALARAILHTNEERRTDVVMDKRVAMRRIDTCVACVIAELSATENDLQRKLSALAIRTQSQSSQEPPSPVIPALRELYVGAAGPLSALVFDRAIEQLKITRKARSLEALRELMESLAGPMTPIWVKNEMLEKVAALLAEQAKLEVARVPPPPRIPSLPVAPARNPSAPPTHNLRPVAVVAQVARDVVGAAGDIAVQNGVELFSRLDAHSATMERLVALVASELPEVSRSKFSTEARVRLSSLPR